MNTQATQKQIPDSSILDYFNKQVYLGNQFIYTATGSVGASETNFLLLSNPVKSGIGIFQNFSKLLTTTASQNVTLRFYLNPTVTGPGSAVTPINLRPANTNTPIATLATAPTTSANGKLIAISYSSGALADVSKILSILDGNNSMLITAQASAASTGFISELSWYEL